MSWLEYLGLEYLLSDEGDHIYDGMGSGILLCAGIGSWLLLAFFKGGLVDQGATVFNLLAAIILLVLSVIKYYRNLKYTENVAPIVKVYYIISAIVVIAFFVNGIFNPYHALIFEYEYKGIFSCIAWTFYPLVILNILYPFFCKNNRVGEKLQECLETVGLAFILLIALFFIGQIATVILFFCNGTGLYDKIAIYHDLSVKEVRENWEYKDCKDYINKNLPEAATNLVKQYEEENNTNISKVNYLRNHYPINDDDFKNNGLVFDKRKFISSSIVIYGIIDKEYYDHYYVKFDYDSNTILEYVDYETFSNTEVYEET